MTSPQRLTSLLLVLAICSTCFAHPDDPKLLDRQAPFVGASYRLGVDGPADPRGSGFASSNVTLHSWITLSDIAAFSGTTVSSGNDCWGYTSPSGREYALVGVSSGLCFVEITNPDNAQIIWFIPGPESLWRDVKVYQNYAYVVSEGGSGIQVISMANIDQVTNRVSLVGTITTGGGTATHNVAINTDSGYLYRCGGGSNGIRIYDLANPASPTYVTSWSDRYVHDCQVVTYTTGPLAGHEIAYLCSGSNGGGTNTGLDILDVTDKNNIINLYPSRITWPSAAYSHQVWLSPDLKYAYINDELDETGSTLTRTIVVDVQFMIDENVPAPFLASTFDGTSVAINHNLYTKDDLLFEANYRSGLRVFCTTADPLNPEEIAYFDTYPGSDSANFNGAWSNYPYFPSGNVIISDLERGLFVVSVQVPGESLSFGYPKGKPSIVSPAEDTSFAVSVGAGACTATDVLPGTQMLHYDIGNGLVTVPLIENGGDFIATIPASPCGEFISYYFSSQSESATTYFDPPGAPGVTYTALSELGEIAGPVENFQTDTGWTTAVVSATSGGWQRGVPIIDTSWPYTPLADSDGSGQCFVTQNGFGNTDVDNGAVQLVSPPLDMSGEDNAITFDYYLYLSDSQTTDRLLVEIDSNNGAGPWTTIFSDYSSGARTWRNKKIYATELASAGVTLTSTMRLRFTVNDSTPQGVVEGGIDAVGLFHLDCFVPVTCTKGDVTDDGSVNGNDIQPFINVLFGSATLGTVEFCAADMNDSGDVEATNDLSMMVDCLVNDVCP